MHKMVWVKEKHPTLNFSMARNQESVNQSEYNRTDKGAKHIAWIDDAKTLTMLLVIIGHCTYYEIMTPFGGISYFSDLPSSSEFSFMWKLLGIMNAFIYTFHMPLFMLLSGACFNISMRKNIKYKALLLNKTKRLLIPFLYTTLLVSIPLKLFSGYYDASSNVLHDIILGQLLLMGNSHLWFVFSLFWIFLFYYGLHYLRVTDKKWFLPFLAVISIVATDLSYKGYSFLGLTSSMKHLLYFAIGFKYLHRLDSTKWGRCPLLVNVLCYVGLFLLNCMGLFLLSKFIGDVNISAVKIPRYVLSVAMSIYGSLIMIQVSKCVSRLSVITSKKIYKSLSRNSYELYLFSDPFNYVLIFLLTQLLGDYIILSNIGSLLSFCVRFFGTIIFAFAMIWLKNKIVQFWCANSNPPK